jgi:hypothetical protein
MPDRAARQPLSSFRYGRQEPVSLNPDARDTRPRKYLAFEIDLGGFNNILMHFEIMVVLASLTGRTLVLPPRTPFYLLGSAPRSLLDFFDRHALQGHIDVVKADEFAAQHELGGKLGLHDRFHGYMQRNGHCPEWNAVRDTLVHPPNALTERFELIPRLFQRRPVAIIGPAEQCGILYFPSTHDHRMFGVFEAFFLFADTRNERVARTLVRDAVRYRPEILQLAERALESPLLAGSSFSSMHVRRGDFQYKETRIAAESILRHTNNLFRPGQTIYVATDEQDPAFLDTLRERYEVITFGMLGEEFASQVPPEWTGIVETLICAAAPERFVGTRLSTLTARIGTLRGYLSSAPNSALSGIDTALYYTQPPINPATPDEGKPYGEPRRKHVDEFGETGRPWWESICTVPVWGRAHRAIWAETD